MALRFIGKWGGSPNGDSPSLWIDDETGESFMQGWVVDDPEMRADLLRTAGRDHVPDNETLIRWPASMADLFLEAHRDKSGPDVR